MEVDISIEFTRETLSTYKHFTESAFSNCLKLLAQISDGINSDLSQDVLTHCLHHLKSLELPTCQSSFSVHFLFQSISKSCLFAFQPLDSLVRRHLLSSKYVIVQIRLQGKCTRAS